MMRKQQYLQVTTEERLSKMNPLFTLNDLCLMQNWDRSTARSYLWKWVKQNKVTPVVNKKNLWYYNTLKYPLYTGMVLEGLQKVFEHIAGNGPSLRPVLLSTSDDPVAITVAVSMSSMVNKTFAIKKGRIAHVHVVVRPDSWYEVVAPFLSSNVVTPFLSSESCTFMRLDASAAQTDSIVFGDWTFSDSFSSENVNEDLVVAFSNIVRDLTNEIKMSFIDFSSSGYKRRAKFINKISVQSRLALLPSIFTIQDLVDCTGIKKKLATTYASIWVKRGLIAHAGSRLGYYYNLFLEGEESKEGKKVFFPSRRLREKALAKFCPSAILCGVSVLYRHGWIKEEPYLITIISKDNKCLNGFAVSRRPDWWYSLMQENGVVLELSPEQALADLLVFGDTFIYDRLIFDKVEWYNLVFVPGSETGIIDEDKHRAVLTWVSKILVAAKENGWSLRQERQQRRSKQEK